MIGSTRRLSVYAYGQPCDMRKSFDALSGLVTQELGRDFLSGDVFLFVGRDRKRAKALFWDGTGLYLYAKRLEKGRFAPLWQRESGVQPLVLTVSELALFLEGSELVGRAPLSPAPYTLKPLFQPEAVDVVTS
ncbi:IS66 family insertion sequence element accessory protein TnpB [Archangium violaceum]|uniref:IS66 family insertion sequence element accessory protein TnpB n=1 Tax=Archangium violaceum TaxID=83451 RepID=UPI002B2F262C|nr:IS66 family insertion sequence element accessory protein TnpB [Archangium gephyra]